MGKERGREQRQDRQTHGPLHFIQTVQKSQKRTQAAVIETVRCVGTFIRGSWEAEPSSPKVCVPSGNETQVASKLPRAPVRKRRLYIYMIYSYVQ